MSQFTASEVRLLVDASTKAMHDLTHIGTERETGAELMRASAYLENCIKAARSFADLLEAQERAVPVAWQKVDDPLNVTADPLWAQLSPMEWTSLYTNPPAASVTDAEDAARYRWLREGDNDDKVLERTGDDWDEVFLPRLERLDSAIDAARAKEPQS